MQQNFKKIRYLLLGAIFIFFTFVSLNYISYLNYGAILSGIALLLIGIVMLLYFVSNLKANKIISFLPILGLVLMVADSFFIISRIYPNALTDEIIIQTYAAKMFLEGKDPYINSNMSGVFNFIQPNPLYVTPGLNGKLVETVLYPGMSVLAFVPVALFNLPDYTILLVVSGLNLVVMYRYLNERKMVNILPYFAVVLLLSIYTFGLSIGGSTDILWIFFLILSYTTRNKPWLSGLFYGLSLSSKQLSVIAFPFLLYLIFKEKNRSYKQIFSFFLFSSLSFLLTNLPFIIMQPWDWLRNIIGAEFQPVFGIGIGFSELSFTGLVNIPSSVFTLIFISFTIILFLIYIKFFNDLKYAIFVFPMFIFLFNFRLLLGYVLDWALLVVLTYADYVKENQNRAVELDEIKTDRIIKIPNKGQIREFLSKNTTFAIVILVIIGGTAGGAVYLDSQNTNAGIYHITSVSNLSDPNCIPDIISKMNVTIVYTPADGMNLTSPIFFRIITSGNTNGNYNGLLWHSNKILHEGKNNITIFPNNYADLINAGTFFTIQAYNEEVSNIVKISTKVSNSTYGLSNYKMDYITNSASNPFVCWSTEKNSFTDSFSYRLPNNNGVLSNGFNLSTNSTSNVDSVISLQAKVFNLSYLALANKSLHFDYSYSGNGSNLKGSSSKNFEGIKIVVNDQYNFYVGMNRTLKANSEYQNGTDYYIFTPNGLVNFSQINNILETVFSVRGPLISSFSFELYSSQKGLHYFSAYNFSMIQN